MFFEDLEEKYGKHFKILGIKTPNKSLIRARPESQISVSIEGQSLNDAKKSGKEEGEKVLSPVPIMSQTPLGGMVTLWLIRKSTFRCSTEWKISLTFSTRNVKIWGPPLSPAPNSTSS